MGAEWAAVWVALLIGVATVIASGTSTWLQLREGRLATLRQARLGHYAQLITLLNELAYPFRDIDMDAATLERIDVSSNTIVFLSPPQGLVQVIDLCASLAREIVFGTRDPRLNGIFLTAIAQLVDLAQADLNKRMDRRTQRAAQGAVASLMADAGSAGFIPRSPSTSVQPSEDTETRKAKGAQ